MESLNPILHEGDQIDPPWSIIACQSLVHVPNGLIFLDFVPLRPFHNAIKSKLDPGHNAPPQTTTSFQNPVQIGLRKPQKRNLTFLAKI